MHTTQEFWTTRRRAGGIMIFAAGAVALSAYQGHAAAQPHAAQYSQTRSTGDRLGQLCDPLSNVEGAMSPSDYRLAQEGTSLSSSDYQVKLNSSGNWIVCVPLKVTEASVGEILPSDHDDSYDQPRTKIYEVEMGIAVVLAFAGTMLELPYP